MTVAPPPTRPATPPARGRHRSDDGPSTDLAALLAEAGPRTGGTHRSAATPTFARAARTAGLSLAALGALATAGGVATQGFGTGDEPAATGELALGSQLAAADLSVDPAPAVTAPAVLPAAVAAPAVADVAATRSAPGATAQTVSARPSSAASGGAATKTSDDADDDEGESSSTAAASSVGAEAVAAAKSKVGKPYVWGATGPNSFDCSGLTSWAYKQAGKSLPRTSKAQSQFGQKVSTSDLQPGDLVFFYSPVSHVAMYIGDGKIVEAPNSRANVRIKSLSIYDGDIVGARRIA